MRAGKRPRLPGSRSADKIVLQGLPSTADSCHFWHLHRRHCSARTVEELALLGLMGNKRAGQEYPPLLTGSATPSCQQLHRRTSRGLHLRNVRAARGCSAVLTSSAVRLRWRANAVRGKIEIDPLQATAGQQSLVQTLVCKHLIKRRGVTLGVTTGTHAKKLERLTESLKIL